MSGGREVSHFVPDGHKRGDLVRDKDGDVWRKGTGWWHWTGRNRSTGAGKLLWAQLSEMYGPLTGVPTKDGQR